MLEEGRSIELDSHPRAHVADELVHRDGLESEQRQILVRTGRDRQAQHGGHSITETGEQRLGASRTRARGSRLPDRLRPDRRGDLHRVPERTGNPGRPGRHCDADRLIEKTRSVDTTEGDHPRGVLNHPGRRYWHRQPTVAPEGQIEGQ